MTDKYELISLIGKGNFGSISKIRRKSDGKILVWKELNYGLMDDKDKHRIVSEVNILRELHHPNIVKYYDRIIDKQNTKIYIIMEYCAGGDLNQLIKKCRHSKQYINEDIIWKIFSQVACALYACHTHKTGKILHRDIKPSNVFLDKDNNVKLGDFGLSRMLNQDINFAYSNVGTPYYMSPEQIDEIKYNEKSDIWSLGCFLYELTSLHPPFEANNHLTLALKIKSGKVDKLPSNYSETLCKTILWLMNVDQNKRPTLKEIISIPNIAIRIKEKKVKDGYQKLKKYENELKIREENIIEKEKQIKVREKYLDEREKNIVQRENFIKMKEEEFKYNNYNSMGVKEEKKHSNKFINNSLFITSGGFDIIKNLDNKHSNSHGRSFNSEKIHYDYDKHNYDSNISYFSNKLPNSNRSKKNDNSLKKNSHRNSSINNNVNFNNSNNSFNKFNSSNNMVENPSKIISFNSDLNFSDEERMISSNNTNGSNMYSIGCLSINSQGNNDIFYNNNNGSNMNNSIKNNLYHNRPSNSNNKNSHMEDYKSVSTNYFSSKQGSGGSFIEGGINNSMNNNINYNSFNINNKANDNKDKYNDSQRKSSSPLGLNININKFNDGYRMAMENSNNDNNTKRSKHRLNVEYNKEYSSEYNVNEYEFSKMNTKRKSMENMNYKQKGYIPNNFRNESYGKKININKNEEQSNDNSFNIKYINYPNKTNGHRKRYIENKSSNSINAINFNNSDNKENNPDSFRFNNNANDKYSNEENWDDYKYKNSEKDLSIYENNKNQYFKQKNGYYNEFNSKRKMGHLNNNYNNINYNTGSKKELNSTKNKNYNNVNVKVKEKSPESSTYRIKNNMNNDYAFDRKFGNIPKTNSFNNPPSTQNKKYIKNNFTNFKQEVNKENSNIIYKKKEGNNMNTINF